MTDARCIAIYGRRGTGKSTLVQKLTEGCNRIIAFDPTGEYQRKFKWRARSDLHALNNDVIHGWSRGFRLAYIPRGDVRRELHQISTYLWHAQEPYELGRDKRMVVLVVEEMNLGCPVTMLPEGMRGFQHLALQGRHRGIEIIGVTQRPALISADFRGMLLDVYVLPLAFEEDQRVMGRRHAPVIAALGGHRHLHFRDGALVGEGGR